MKRSDGSMGGDGCGRCRSSMASRVGSVPEDAMNHRR
ncbi:hypothetical protein AWB81_07091 [Caballeronia arationis]|jgi:hypothetical protein|uniref:Uncharacterized protein n=1 Tax=Caballeronia arationis TaxID=1777142 RepID=A0A7Z7I2R8_9BURK|nr:hypothetical protein AWB81_07091 [Caballeronia arationis]SOE53322.1 hypothetical protein SAMN05446927_0633 [Caballeronia arationis]